MDIFARNDVDRGTFISEHSAPRSRWSSRPIAAKYAFFQHPTLSPSFFGQPARRKRKYTMWAESESMKLRLPPVMSFNDLFIELFQRTILLDCGIFVKVPRATRSNFLQQRLRADGFFDIADHELCDHMALSPSEVIRLIGFSRLAAEKGLISEDEGWCVSVAIVNLSQTAQYAGLIDSSCAPTLLRRSVLFDLVSDQLVLPQAHFAIQGYPASELMGDRCSFFAFVSF